MQLSEALTEFYQSKIGITSEATRRWYQARLSPLLAYLSDVELTTIATADLRRWRASLVAKEKRWDNHPHRPEEPGGLSPSTLYAYLNACRIFFRWLEEESILEPNPARRLRLPPKPKGEPKRDISQVNALAILEAARDNPRDFAILRFLADTGCRISGVAGLKLGRLQLQPDAQGRYRAIVAEKGQGGQRKFRTVYFGPATAQALSTYCDLRPLADTDHVFLTQQPGRPIRPLREEGIYRMIQRYAKSAGVTGRWNPHSWRHAFAHGLIEAGADIGLVSQMMGHSSPVITIEFYGQRADKRLADEHAKFSWLNNGQET